MQVNIWYDDESRNKVLNLSIKVNEECGAETITLVTCPYCGQVQGHNPQQPMAVCGLCGDEFPPASLIAPVRVERVRVHQ